MPHHAVLPSPRLVQRDRYEPVRFLTNPPAPHGLRLQALGCGVSVFDCSIFAPLDPLPNRLALTFWVRVGV